MDLSIIEYFPGLLLILSLLLKIVLELGYVFQHIIGLFEKNKAKKLLKEIYGKKQVVCYTLQENININLLKNIIDTKFMALTINGILQMNHKIVRIWDKDSEIKVEYTILENGHAETDIFYNDKNDNWIKLEHPERLMDSQIENNYHPNKEVLKSWQLEAIDAMGFKDKSRSTNLLCLTSFVSFIVYIVASSVSQSKFNLFNFIYGNLNYIILVILITISILLSIIVFQLFRIRTNQH